MHYQKAVFYHCFFHEENIVRFLTTLTLLAVVPITVACADSDPHAMRQKLLKPLIEQQCQSELKSLKIWQAASIFWSDSQQQHAQQKICGCVSDSALKDISNKDLVMASVNEETKNKVIHQAVLNSIKGCAQEVLK